MMQSSSQHLAITVMWTLLLILVSSISLTTSKSLKYGEGDNENDIITAPVSDEDDTLLGSLPKLNLGDLPDNYENRSSHVEHIGDHDVKVHTNVSHHKTNHSESTKYSQSKVMDGDNNQGFQKAIYQEFSFGGGQGDPADEDEEMQEEARKQMKVMEKLEDFFQQANEEMRELFDNII